jgi:arabinofuranosyltransferase
MKHRQQNWSLLFFLTLFALIILRSAWLSEDAYITLRTVDNFVHGHGLRWNIAERVQSYTHPLWMFCLSFLTLVTKELYYTPLFLSIVFSILAVYIVSVKLAKDTINGILGISVLTFSKAFIDYSTSGLENPLIHLILALFFLGYYRFEYASRHRILLLVGLAALGILNRMDTILLFAPPLVYLLFKRSAVSCASKVWTAVVGFSPFIIWELFSLLYYGFPFPNTAYAKLKTGLHRSELIEQGWYYLLNSLDWDPITLFSIFSIAFASIWFYRKDCAHLFVGLSILFYLAYIIKIGGGFMSGRFLAAPLLCAVIMLVRFDIKPLKEGVPLLGLICLLGMSGSRPTILNSGSYEMLPVDDRIGIADERGAYYASTGLLTRNRKTIPPVHEELVEKGKEANRDERQVVVWGNIGFFGLFAGPDVHIIDPGALSDPLLARLPVSTFLAQKGASRIGHFTREIPKGYPESTLGTNVMKDVSLREYWEKLSFVTRGNLWDWRRIQEIWRFNTGQNEYLLHEYCLRQYAVEEKILVPFNDEGSSWNAPGNYLLNRYGIGIKITSADFETGRFLYGFSMSVHGGEKYVLAYYRDGSEIERYTFNAPHASAGGLILHQGFFSHTALQQRFDMIRILPGTNRGKHSLGHFQVLSLQPVQKTLTELRDLKPEGTPRGEAGNFVFGKRQFLLVELERLSHANLMEISADHNDRYQVSFLRDETVIGQTMLPGKRIIGGGLSVRELKVAPDITEKGYDKLLILPMFDGKEFSIGHIRLNE